MGCHQFFTSVLFNLNWLPLYPNNSLPKITIRWGYKIQTSFQLWVPQSKMTSSEFLRLHGAVEYTGYRLLIPALWCIDSLSALARCIMVWLTTFNPSWNLSIHLAMHCLSPLPEQKNSLKSAKLEFSNIELQNSWYRYIL